MPHCNFNSPQAYADAIKDLPKPSQKMRDEAEKRQQQLTKPLNSLGMLEEIAVFLCGWQEREKTSTALAALPYFCGQSRSHHQRRLCLSCRSNRSNGC